MTDSIVFINYDEKIIQGEVSHRDEDTNLNFCHFCINDKVNLLYSGEIKNGYTHGKGTLLYDYSYSDGDSDIDEEYMGNFQNGMRDGYGISYHSSYWYTYLGMLEYHRKEYEGEWKKNQRNGKGTEYWYYGEILYEGEWKNDLRHGKGISYYREQQKEYEGGWKNNQRYGKGISYYENGQKEYEGEWRNGDKFGKGIFYDISGNIESKGRYIQGKWFDETTFYLRKYVETRDSSLLKKITGKEIQSFIKKNFETEYESQKRKPFLILELEKLSEEKKKEIIIEEIEYDEFGNEITTQCLGSDGNIYDISSMYYLFEKNEEGDYKNISYKYENNIRVPNYPRMGNGKILERFEILIN